MKYIKFKIKKFKGIDELELDLSKISEGKIFPLIGLNEAGKTTILEAIDFFQNGVEEGDEHKLIHKRDKGSFTGEITVTATLQLEKEDKQAIRSFFEDKKFKLNKDIKEINITQKFEYKDGKFSTSKNLWGFFPPLEVKSPKAKKYKELYSSNEDLWQMLVDQIEKNLLPKILYFEDFIFDFPESIYLEDLPNQGFSEEEKERQKKYREVIEDILKTCNDKYSRIGLISKLNSTDDGDVDSGRQIIKEMESVLNKKILKYWNDIFPDSPDMKISIESDRGTNGRLLNIKISQDSSVFNISERSLGFKWFFSFILFTEFRKSRSNERGEYLFLFDEPAKNLHESAQKKFLILFDKITDKAKIIYSTHSPYMLKPEYLLTAFIVKDSGRKNGIEYDYRQNIKAFPYRQFVSEYPNQKTHYKPLLDVLEFHAHDFDFKDPIVFTEGKNDYYTFKWFLENYFKDEDYNFKFYPGGGITNYSNIFREYLAHNKNFIAIFDADVPDIKKGYIDEISQELKKRIFTLKDIDNQFDGLATEDLFNEKDKIKIIKKVFPEENSYNKKKFNWAIQELFIKKEKVRLLDETTNNFKKVFTFIETKLKDLQG